METPPPIEQKEKLKIRILHAEDDPAISATIKRAINRKYPDAEIVQVRDGQELLDKLNNSEPFNLIITDNDMPNMRGIDALKEIKDNERFRTIPVLIVSGGMAREEEEEVKKLGARFLSKPFGLGDLYGLIGELVKIEDSQG